MPRANCAAGRVRSPAVSIRSRNSARLMCREDIPRCAFAPVKAAEGVAGTGRADLDHFPNLVAIHVAHHVVRQRLFPFRRLQIEREVVDQRGRLGLGSGPRPESGKRDKPRTWRRRCSIRGREAPPGSCVHPSWLARPRKPPSLPAPRPVAISCPGSFHPDQTALGGEDGLSLRAQGGFHGTGPPRDSMTTMRCKDKTKREERIRAILHRCGIGKTAWSGDIAASSIKSL